MLPSPSILAGFGQLSQLDPGALIAQDSPHRRLCSCLARLHLITKLALTPCSRATPATDAPGCSISSRSLRLKAALRLRFVVMMGDEFDSCMVST